MRGGVSVGGCVFFRRIVRQSDFSVSNTSSSLHYMLPLMFPECILFLWCVYWMILLILLTAWHGGLDRRRSWCIICLSYDWTGSKSSSQSWLMSNFHPPIRVLGYPVPYLHGSSKKATSPTKYESTAVDGNSGLPCIPCVPCVNHLNSP